MSEPLHPPGYGGLHEISATIGEIRAYIHENRHGVANLSMKMDGLSLDVAKQIAALETKMSVRIEQTHNALTAEIAKLQGTVRGLEADKQRREGATGIVALAVKSPALRWIAAAVVTAWGFATGRVHL